MTRILAVDDSRAIRMMVAKQIRELGFECDEAEDGVQGLAKVEGNVFDLVVLDVTMPNLDGPGMLKQMRDQGNTTPVIMLTSESKRSIISDVIRMGIDDYILKPFKAEELQGKIRKSLKIDGAAGAGKSSAEPANAPNSSGANSAVGATKQAIDILLVDDMTNVEKRFRQILPASLSMDAVLNAKDALQQCRDRSYRVIVVDMDIPDVNSYSLVAQLKLLQPRAVFIALCLKAQEEQLQDLRKHGFENSLTKPFDEPRVVKLITNYFENQNLLQINENILRIEGFVGVDDRIGRYYFRVQELLKEAMKTLAAACYEDAIVDVSKIPLRGDMTPKFVCEVEKLAKLNGMVLKLVGTPEGATVLKTFSDTAAVPFFASIEEAQS